MVPKALAVARGKAAAVGVTPRFIEGDFTQLLDLGCFHTLPADQRPSYVTTVSAAAAPGATLLLYGFTRPPKGAPMHAGITTDEVRRQFTPHAWELISAERTSADSLGIGIRHADDRFELWRYRLRRTTTP